MSYFYHPAAESEHLESVAYFESKRPGLGAQYFAEFEQVMEKACASQLIDEGILDKISDLKEPINKLITARMDSYWASERGESEFQKNLHALFKALEEALEFIELISGFNVENFDSFKSLFNAYREEHFRIVQHYRRFHYWCDQGKMWSILNDLSDRINSLYLIALPIHIKYKKDEARTAFLRKMRGTHWRPKK